MAATLHQFADGPALATGLATAVAGALNAAIADRGTASLAVSGGSTPKAFFRALSAETVAWDKVVVTLVDERFVPPSSDRSNHGLVAANLLQGAAAAARFVPLYSDVATVDDAAEAATVATAGISNPFDVAIVGMGNDGHTASFFPGGSRLAEALDAGTPRGVITMEAEGAGEARLTFTFSALQDARLLVLHIEGEGKRQVLSAAESDGDEQDMPIRAILRRAKTPLSIYWAP